MSISSTIKKIGRGVKGASDLPREEAKEIFQKILNQEVSSIELGAFCIAMRMKGETAEELAGFLDAVKVQLNLLYNANRRTIVLPSYNGSRRQMNLTPLLALALIRMGFLVVVQGIEEFDDRVTSYQIFQKLKWPILENIDQWDNCIKANLPIFVPLKVIHPRLQSFLDIRYQLGLRNSGHVLAKLLNPMQDMSWQISNYTHPEYPKILESFFNYHPTNVVLMRGHEGEPTAAFNRLPEMHFFAGSIKTITTQEYRFDDQFIDIPTILDIDAHCQYLQKLVFSTEIPVQSIRTQTELLVQHCI